MKALFLTAAISFAACALTWFFAWAIWVHAPKEWSGQVFSPLVAADRGIADPLTVRLVGWYRRVKVATRVLFVLSAVLLWAWHESTT